LEYVPTIWILLAQKSRLMGLGAQRRKEWRQGLKLACAQPLEVHMEELEDMEAQRPGTHSRWRDA